MTQSKPASRLSSINPGRFVRSVLYSLVLLPVLLAIWFVSAIVLYLGDGGDFGGYGAAPSDPASWVRPVQNILLVLTFVWDAALGVRFYRRRK